jgi:hypothetical protein
MNTESETVKRIYKYKEVKMKILAEEDARKTAGLNMTHLLKC